MNAPRIRLGELLVDAGIITSEQLGEVLELQQREPRRLGELLVETGLVTETQVTQILSQQLSIPWVSLYHIDFSRQLLDLVSVELAWQYSLVPIFVRRIRGHGNVLYLAMNDPSDEGALEAVGRFAGLPVRAMIAPPSDIRGALRAYYPTAESLREETLFSAPPAAPAEATGSAPPPAGPSRPEPKPVFGPPRPSGYPGPSPTRRIPTHPPPPGPTLDAREAGMPRAKKATARRMVTLTLLDGSQVTLPARTARRGATRDSDPAALEPLTTRDILLALRAKLHGQDPSEVLGDHGQWEALVAALLAVLLKKQAIADWEFIEELKRL